VTRKNSDIFFFKSSKFEKTFSETHAVPYVSHISMKITYLKYIQKLSEIYMSRQQNKALLWQTLKCAICNTFFLSHT